MSIKCVVTTGVFAAVLFAGAALAETTWAPPAEIAPNKPSAPSTEAAPSAAPTATPAKTAGSTQDVKAVKARDCKARADAKGLHGKARDKFRADCVKS